MCARANRESAGAAFFSPIHCGVSTYIDHEAAACNEL